jgi:hypothetical protein
MFGILILCIGIGVFILVLSLMAISKGYSYEHKVDPLPDDNPYDDKKETNK